MKLLRLILTATGIFFLNISYLIADEAKMAKGLEILMKQQYVQHVMF